MDEPAVRARGINRCFGDVVALDDIDLDVARGQIHGLVGPNGAGKTTLLSILVLALEPTEGTMCFDGVDAARGRARAAIRRQIGFLPQDFQPLRHLTGVEYLIHCVTTGEPVTGPLSPTLARIGQQIVDSAVASAREKRTLPLLG